MARNEEHFVTIQKEFKFFIALSPREMEFFLLWSPCKTVFRFFKSSGSLHIKSFFQCADWYLKGVVLVVFRAKKDLKMYVARRARMPTFLGKTEIIGKTGLISLCGFA
jgi:hypothetical protein